MIGPSAPRTHGAATLERSVVPDLPAASTADQQRLIGWLEEQREIDHERLVELVRSVEQLKDELRDQGAMLAHLVDGSDRRVDDGHGDALMQTRERIALIERALGDHFEAAVRAEQVQAAQSERALRQITELVQHVSALGRATDAANGRIGALAEEMRHLRDERAPLTQALDEIQRVQSNLQTRVAIADELARRYSNFQSVAEQSGDRQRTEIGRLDSQQKLLDLRLTRELADVRNLIDEWVARSDERLKPVAELVRQTAMLDEQRELSDQRVAGLTRDVATLGAEIGRLDSQSKVDRMALKRSVEASDAQSQRIDETGAAVWQLAERLSATAASLDDLRSELDLATQRIDEAERRISRLDEEQQQLQGTLSGLGAEIHSDRRDTRDQSGNLLAHVDSEVASLRVQIATVHGLAVAHLRRTVDELQQQLRELEAD